MQVRSLAREIHEQHFQIVQSSPRGVVAQLAAIVNRIRNACDAQIQPKEVGGGAWQQVLQVALHEFVSLLEDEHSISSYELHTSGLVQALAYCLGVSSYSHCSVCNILASRCAVVSSRSTLFIDYYSFILITL